RSTADERRVFDHVAISVSDLAASERFYRTVLSILGAEPSHADAGLVEWEDWDIGAADREHPVTRGLHVGFRARDRAQVDAFWQAGVEAGYRDEGAPGPPRQDRPAYHGGGPPPPPRPPPPGAAPRQPGAGRPHRPPLDPRPRPAGLTALLHDDRPARRAAAGARRARPRAAVRPGLQLLARPGRAAADPAHPPRVPRTRGRHRARV